MSTLKFPVDVNSSDPDEYYELRRVDEGESGPPVEHLAHFIKLIHTGHSTVYRCILFRGPGKLPPYDVVCKFVYGKLAIERLRKETNFYLHELKDLQGKYVPNLAGLFEGEMENGLTACLVLSYCGRPLTREFWAMKTDQRLRIMDALLAIHEAGVQHGNFTEWNVVKTKRGRFFIVDFDHAEPHKCEVPFPLPVRGVEPLMGEVKCREVYWACKTAHLWAPRTILFMRRMVPVQYAKTAELLAKQAPPGTDPRYALYRANIKVDELIKQHEERKAIDEAPDSDPELDSGLH